MTEVTLTRVFRKDSETKYGIKPKVAIQTTQFGDKWLSTFKVAGTENWKEGDVVQINVQEKGDWLNFEPRNDGGAPVRAGTLAQASSPVEEPVIQADDLPDMEDTDDGF